MTETQAYAKRWWMLAVLVLSVMVVSLDNTILNVALPRIQETLGASQSQQAWIVDSYLLVFAGSLLTFGAMGDRFGRRRMLSFGLLVFGLGSLVSTFATSPAQLIFTRASMGIGGAAIMPATLAIITRVFPPEERGRAIGLWAGVTGLSTGAGPLAGGVLLEHFWWGSVFLVNVPVVAIALVLGRFLVPESKSEVAAKFDPLGVLLSIAGLTAFVYGIIKGGELGTIADARVIAPVLLGIVILAQFAHHELHSSQPMIDLRIFKIRAFSAASISVSLIFFALMGSTFFLTFYLQFVRERSPLMTGLWLLPMAVPMTMFAPRSAKLVARFGTRPVATSGMMLVAFAFLGYQFVGTQSALWLVAGILFLIGSGMAVAMAPATTAIMNSLPLDRAGAGSAINNTTRQVGGALGVAILGSILAGEYRHYVAPVVKALPINVQHRAGESIGATLSALHAAGPSAAGLIEPAKQAFVDAFHVASIGSSLVAFIGALVLLRWLPHTSAKAEAAQVAALPSQRLHLNDLANAQALAEV